MANLLAIIAGFLIYQNSFVQIGYILISYVLYKKSIRFVVGALKYDYLLLLYGVLYAISGVLLGNNQLSTRFCLLLLMPILIFGFQVTVFKKIDNALMCRQVIFFSLGIAVLNTISALNYNYSGFGTSGYMVDIAFNNIEMNPVNVNSLGCLGCAYAFYVYSKKQKDLLYFVALITFALTMFVSLRLSKRSNLVFCGIVFLVNFVLFIYKKGKIRLVILAALGVILLGQINYQSWSVFQRERVFSTAESANVRIRMWKLYLPMLLKKPFSGNTIVNPYYKWAHNIFLDVYIQAGIVTMLILVLIYIIHFIDLYKIYKCKGLCIEIKSFWISISAILFFTVFTEPAYEGILPIVIIDLAVMSYCHSFIHRENEKIKANIQ